MHYIFLNHQNEAIMTTPLPFIGRKQELKSLKELAKIKEASIVVVRGRSRIGKTRLIQEFTNKIPHHIFSGTPLPNSFSAQDQREEFARQLQRELNIPLPRADSWEHLFLHLSQHTQKKKIILILDEINWIGSKDNTFIETLKTAWENHFKNNPRLMLILCGSDSLWIKENILSHMAISLDIHLSDHTLSECNEYWNMGNNQVSAYDKFKILSVTGGVPRYLAEVIPDQTAENNIEKLCFQKEGSLFNEFEHIFSKLFKSRSLIYKTIIERLAESPCELTDIYEALKVQKSGVISGYMDDLIEAGFVSQDFTWHLKTGIDSKLSLYRLKDNYLRFYFKYIRPNQKKIENQGLKLHHQWQSAMGTPFFDNLVLNNRKSVHKILGIESSEIVNDDPFFQSKTKDRPGCHIDYMIQTKFGVCYLCEIEFCNEAISFDVIDKIKQKMGVLALPKNIAIRPVLLHVNGVDEQVTKSGFFSNIIDFNTLLGVRFE